ncbi:MAG: hypothetical protein V3U54_13335 [Thermodesulfobacteriota bacterium]
MNWKIALKGVIEFCPFCKQPFGDPRCECTAHMIQYQTGLGIKNYIDVVKEMEQYAWENREIKRLTAYRLLFAIDRFFEIRSMQDRHDPFLRVDEFYVTVTECLARMRKNNKEPVVYGTSPVI